MIDYWFEWVRGEITVNNITTMTFEVPKDTGDE